MAGRTHSRVVIRPEFYSRVQFLPFAVLSALLFLGASTADGEREYEHFIVESTVALIAFLLAVRALRIGVWTDDHFLVVRGLLRNRRFLLNEVEAVSRQPYSGYWNWSGRSGLFRMLCISLKDDRLIEVPEFSGGNAVIQSAADLLNYQIETWRRRQEEPPAGL